MLHEEALIIDGLMIAGWSEDIFHALRKGGVTAVNCTTSVESVWEGFTDAMRTIAQWKKWLDRHNDILLQVRTADDILKAKAEGKTGIILGWQNSSGFDGYLPYVELFWELGLRVVQMTYHTANLAGGGCLEPHDGGLTGWGYELVEELNRAGILIDLSHVGPRTSSDVIRASRQPVVYTHCAPYALKAHPRNKTDVQLREIADRGGLVGVTMFTQFLAKGPDSTLDDYVDAIVHVLDVCGEDHTAIGTDFTQGVDRSRTQVLLRDKGYGRALLDDPGDVKAVQGFSRIEEFPNLTAALEHRGLPVSVIRKIMGENWLRIYRDVWR